MITGDKRTIKKVPGTVKKLPKLYRPQVSDDFSR